MTRTLTLLAIGCLLVVGVAIFSVVGHDSVSRSVFDPSADSSIAVSRGPVANRQGKTDKWSGGNAVAALESSRPDAWNEPLRQAFAADSPLGTSAPPQLSPGTIPSQPSGKQKTGKSGQKTYTLLSDAQIAAIKGRLNLTATQEQHWPGVETALRAVAQKIHETKQANPAAGSPPIDPASSEVRQLKSAAMPLLFQLREDQKREVRALARIIGLESVASAI